MGLRTVEALKLRRIEEDLRAAAPGLDALLAGGPPRRGPVLHPPATGVLTGYMVRPARPRVDRA
jgi:hypothetical protein